MKYINFSSSFLTIATAFLLFSFLFFSIQQVHAQNFEIDISGGPAGSSFGNEVIQTNDGSFVFAGVTKGVGSLGEAYLIKTNGVGDTLWTLYCGDGGEDGATSVFQTSDNGFAIGGYSEVAAGAGEVEVMLLKTDEAGNLLWRKTYGGLLDDFSIGMAMTNDGGFALVGHTKSFGAGAADILIVRTDSSGNLLWAKTYGGNSDESARSIRLTPDQGFILCGYTHSFGVGGSGIFVMKVDSIGQISWTKLFDGTWYDEGHCIQNTTDGGFIVAGYTGSFGSGSSDGYVIKLSSVGNLEWSRVIGNSSGDRFYNVIQTSDGNYLVSGQTQDPSTSIWNGLLVKFNDTGDTLWSRSRSIYNINCMKQINNGGFIGTGYGAVGWVNSSVYMLRSDTSGNTTCIPTSRTLIVSSPLTQETSVAFAEDTMSITVGNSFPSILGHIGIQTVTCLSSNVTEYSQNNLFTQLYPNPALDEVTLHFINNADYKIEICDVTGKQLSIHISENQDQIKIPIQNLPLGLYFAKITGAGKTETIKLLKY